ncbi:MAG: hypothetical protein V7L22_27120 [Nostoc sp.]
MTYILVLGLNECDRFSTASLPQVRSHSRQKRLTTAFIAVSNL